MAALTEAQHTALATLEPASPGSAESKPHRLAAATADARRDARWQTILAALCEPIAGGSEFSIAVRRDLPIEDRHDPQAAASKQPTDAGQVLSALQRSDLGSESAASAHAPDRPAQGP